MGTIGENNLVRALCMILFVLAETKLQILGAAEHLFGLEWMSTAHRLPNIRMHVHQEKG